MTLEEKQSLYIYKKTYWLLKNIVERVDKKNLEGDKNDFLNLQINYHLLFLEKEIHDLWNKKINDPQFVEFSDIGDKMLISEWIDCVNHGGFIDYDGFGKFATEKQCSTIQIYPSDFTILKLKIPDWATHIIWYNK